MSFETGRGAEENTESASHFTVDGYGILPAECHNVTDASCTIQVPGPNLIVKIFGFDGWAFSYYIDGDLIDNLWLGSRRGYIDIDGVPIFRYSMCYRGKKKLPHDNNSKKKKKKKKKTKTLFFFF